MDQITHQDKRTHIEWIDDLKAIAIMFVVWGHFASGNILVCRFIYSFHVPLFFFISGDLYKQEQKPYTLILNNFRRLIVPYLVLGGGFGLFKILILIIRRVNIACICDVFYQYITGDIAWFLTGLFFCRIVLNYIPKKMVLLILFLYAMSMPFMNTTSTLQSYFQWIPRTLLCLPFYLIGYLLKDIKIPSRNIYIGSICFLVLIILVYTNKCSPLRFIDSYYVLLVFFLQAFLGIITFYNLSHVVRLPRTVIHNISFTTLLIYTCHYYFLEVFNIIKFHIPICLNNGLISFIISLIVMWILYRPSLFIMKNYPSIMGKSKKKYK